MVTGGGHELLNCFIVYYNYFDLIPCLSNGCVVKRSTLLILVNITSLQYTGDHNI